MFGYVVQITGNATPVRLTPNYWRTHGEGSSRALATPEPGSPTARSEEGSPKAPLRVVRGKRKGEVEIEVRETR